MNLHTICRLRARRLTTAVPIQLSTFSSLNCFQTKKKNLDKDTYIVICDTIKIIRRSLHFPSARATTCYNKRPLRKGNIIKSKGNHNLAHIQALNKYKQNEAVNIKKYMTRSTLSSQTSLCSQMTDNGIRGI